MKEIGKPDEGKKSTCRIRKDALVKCNDNPTMFLETPASHLSSHPV
jgi:hypothetical protein